VKVVIEPLLENTVTQVIYPLQQNLLYGQTKLNAFDLDFFTSLENLAVLKARFDALDDMA
jgi:hypothetical protein